MRPAIAPSLTFVDWTSGARFALSGAGFVPGESIRAYVAPSPSAGFGQFRLLGTTIADPRGAFVLPVDHLPNEGGPLRHFTVQGGKSGFAPFISVTLPATPESPVPTAEPMVAVATLAPLSTETPVPPTPTSPPAPTPTGEWFARYYANRDLAEPPALIRTEYRCDARHQWLCPKWGSDLLDAGMPADSWSATFTRTAWIDSLDNYIFELWVDDGARVYVDGQVVINEWRQGRQRTAYGFRVLGPGEHQIRLDYFDAKGTAKVKLSWWAGYTAWEARYYNSPNLDGPVILKRNDLNINFTDLPGGPSWPGGIGPDNFSVDWVRTVYFPCSCEYEFTAEADDDVRVFIDRAAKPLIDRFGKGPGSETVKRFIRAGKHFVQVQYVERGLDAYVRFSWKPLCPFPPPTVIPPDP